jgi:hypothetical protein
MYTLHTFQDIELTRLMRSPKGLFAFARFPEWHYEYRFFLQPDGKVKGKTSLGFWEELSSEATCFIKAKIQSSLIDQAIPLL